MSESFVGRYSADQLAQLIADLTSGADVTLRFVPVAGSADAIYDVYSA